MASIVTEMMRRRMMSTRGTSFDWETLCRGLLEGTLTGDIVIPDDVTTLRDSAFSGCSAITNITARGVTSIGGSAFNSLMNLETVELGTINSIGTSAFSNCRSLETPIILGNNVTTLGGTIFFNCFKIPYVDVGTGVTSIGNQCFRYMTDCQYVIMRPTTPPTLGSNNFVNSSAATYPIYVPDASVNDYKAASGWSTFASRIFPLSDLTNS